MSTQLVVNYSFKKTQEVILIERKPLRHSECLLLHAYKLLYWIFSLTERQASTIISEAYLW